MERLWIVTKMGWKNTYKGIKQLVDEKFHPQNYVIDEILVPDKITHKWLSDTYMKIISTPGPVVFLHKVPALIKMLSCYSCENSLWVLTTLDGELTLF